MSLDDVNVSVQKTTKDRIKNLAERM